MSDQWLETASHSVTSHGAFSPIRRDEVMVCANHYHSVPSHGTFSLIQMDEVMVYVNHVTVALLNDEVMVYVNHTKVALLNRAIFLGSFPLVVRLSLLCACSQGIRGVLTLITYLPKLIGRCSTPWRKLARLRGRSSLPGMYRMLGRRASMISRAMRACSRARVAPRQ
jgi:hypothetical protein